MQWLAIMFLAIVLVPVVVLTTGPVRIVLGILFILFFPGYTLMAALFPRRDRPDVIGRIALSFVLSIALISLIALALNYTSWGIRTNPIVGGIACFSAITSLIALLRQLRLPEEQRLVFPLHIKLPKWRERHTLDKVLMVVLVIVIVAGIGGLSYMFSNPRVEEKFTEFYFTGQGDYHPELTLGENDSVTVGIINHEGQILNYHIVVDIDGEEAQQTDLISLGDEEKWENTVTFVTTTVGENQSVEFLLYRSDKGEPYLSLNFWLDVNASE
jgi:uncharacterized membrane protein